MNRKFLFFSFLVLSLFFVSACGRDNNVYYFKEDGIMTKNKPTELIEEKKAEKIQIFMFHGTARCVTCVAIGQLSQETVDEYFSEELKTGKIEFREVDIDLAENKELAKKFQASGSALKINSIYDNQDHISEDFNVWRLTSNADKFKKYLKDKIDNILDK